MRLELGPRDLAEGVVTLVDRLAGTKAPVPLAGVAAAVSDALETAQARLYADAEAAREARTVDVTTLDEAREASLQGWARVPWSVLGAEGEQELAASAITVRCLVRPDGTLPLAEDEPDLIAITARSY